jgi:hypothetical protein
MKPDISKPNETIPVDESDNEAPGIAPTNPSSMSRAEDDPAVFERSPEYHDRKAPESAQADRKRHPHSYE